jgi:uncharacterized membrane protein YbhN (UPF0104 family)
MRRSVAAWRRCAPEPLRPAAAFACVAGDWLACALALGACFAAFHTRMHFGILLTGLAIGATAGLISMLPGGLGVQEGTMSGVFVLLGAALEPALLASILFRAVYYLAPFACSLPFYVRILRQRRATASAGGSG